MEQTPLIEFREIRKSFGSNVVLDGINLTIEEGKVTTIIGRSGVGKSVLLKHIVGLLTADEGEILYHGRNLFTLSRAERKALKRRFSYMFQNMALFDSMTVFENIALPLKEKSRISKPTLRQKVAAKMKQLDLHDVDDLYPSQLSGGMRRRVALARAVITDPEIVLFDEPTAGLDPIRRRAVLRMIGRYQREFGFTAIMVSHDIPDIFSVSQKVAMLEKGKILFAGTREEILQCTDWRVQHFIRGEEEGAVDTEIDGRMPAEPPRRAER